MITSGKSRKVSAFFKKDWSYEKEIAKEDGRAEKDWTNFDPKGNVYLIGNKSLGYYKIGLTRNTEAPDARFKTIQQSVPFELDVLKYWFSSHAGSFEKLLHYEFRDNRIRGEWFHFAMEDLLVVVDKIKILSEKNTPNTPNQQDTD